MSNYVVGDIQGCYDELRRLLDQVNFSPEKDTLWVAGDLVARGRGSLPTLQFLHSLGDQAKPILGNHDLHLIAVYLGIKSPKKSDFLNELLESPECDKLIYWLRHQPLLRNVNEHSVMCHAGISPEWSIHDAFEYAHFAEQILQSDYYADYIEKMYSNTPSRISDITNKVEKFIYTLNCFTRMRFCYADSSLELKTKVHPKEAGPHIYPWFDMLNASDVVNKVIFFGHWASLMGQTGRNNRIALDTGCVWGNYMSLFRVEDSCFFTQDKC